MLLKTCEDIWRAAEGDDYGRMRVTRVVCIVLVRYFAALRGEEIRKEDSGVMIKYWDKGMGHPDHPHFPLMLSSRFKVETGKKLFCQPFAHVTDVGCNISCWLS